jgi:hypothetical protein
VETYTWWPRGTSLGFAAIAAELAPPELASSLRFDL